MEHAKPMAEYRINPRNRRQVERRLDFDRWEIVETCASEQDARALWFRLSSQFGQARTRA